MNWLVSARTVLVVALAGAAGSALRAEDLPPPIDLPAPRMLGGMPLMQALKERQSRREFSPAALEPQILSDLLWAAFGINRPEIAHRTAPSAMNGQEIDVYVALANGAYVYEPKAHRLNPIAAGDMRTKTGGQEFTKVAPVAVVLVADLARMVKAKPEVKEPYAWIGAGFISQNIYLYCASAGLATVVHELGDRRPLAAALKLRPDQRIIIAQAVGRPGPPAPKKK